MSGGLGGVGAGGVPCPFGDLLVSQSISSSSKSGKKRFAMVVAAQALAIVGSLAILPACAALEWNPGGLHDKNKHGQGI
jgi:hypothetical protein